MKFFTSPSFLRVSILASAIMLTAGSLQAQPEDNTRPSTTSVNRDTNTVRTDRDDHGNWGWIGLLGLIGLAGLLPKNRRDDRDRDHVDTNNRTSNR